MIKALLLLPLLLAAIPAWSQLASDLEAGAAFSGYNTVRSPGLGGTTLSLSEELEGDAASYVRLRLNYTRRDRHTVSLLVAPLSLTYAGVLGHPLVYEGQTFPAQTPLDVTYRFDSYRLTYRYDFHRTRALRLGAGVTGKIRDAAITVAGGGREAEKSNTGFVPLINFRLAWYMSPRTYLLLEGDALAAPQGRAEDVQLALAYAATQRMTARIGYRVLEGGADNDEVYTFALVHYAGVGFTVAL